MQDSDKIYFAEALNWLRLSYPAAIDESKWRATMAAYFEALREFEKHHLRQAVKAALVAHPQFFPTAGQLYALCREQRIKEAKEGAKLALPEPGETSTTDATEQLAKIQELVAGVKIKSVVPERRHHEGPPPSVDESAWDSRGNWIGGRNV